MKTQVLKLSAPVSVRITQALDIDTAGEAAFDRGLDELGSKECELGGNSLYECVRSARISPCVIFVVYACS
jgi:hypothetical protein